MNCRYRYWNYWIDFGSEFIDGRGIKVKVWEGKDKREKNKNVYGLLKGLLI